MFDWIPEGIIGIGIWLVSGVYTVASWAFEVFLILASGRLIDNSSYDIIIQNFYVVLGIIMLFIISFSLLKGMVSAEESKKSATTIRKMVVNLIVASIVIALLPLIFSFAFDFQDAFITNNNTLGKFFSYGNVGSDDSPISEDNIQRVYSGAFKIVNGVYTAFFNVNVESDTCQKAIEAEKANNPNMLAIDELDVCQRTVEGEKENFKDTMEYVEAKGNFYSYGDFNKKAYDGEIDFNFLLSLLAGFLLLYVGISYCFDMGLRLVKLVFYQLVGPIPIFLSVIPEGKMSGALKQWVKVTLTCYLEVFVRIFAFYFCLFLCREMLKSKFLTSQLYDYNILLALLAQAFILMGIVMFMRQAPKLFSDITGIDSGNMKLGLKNKLKDGGFFGLSKAAAAAASLGVAHGNPFALIRGWKNGWKNLGAEHQRYQDRKDAKASGVRFRDIAADTIRQKFGYTTSAEAEERKLKSGKTSVENQSSSAISYIDSKTGKNIEIAIGDVAEIDDIGAEQLKAKKTKNVGRMAVTNDKIANLDSKISWAGEQKKLKSELDKEADKKFDNGSYEHTIRYVDRDGNMYMEAITGKRLSELSEQGSTFYYADENKRKYRVSYNNSDGHQEETVIGLSEYRRKLSELSTRTDITDLEDHGELSVTEKGIRDEVRNAFITSELGSKNSNYSKTVTANFYEKLASEGSFEVKSYEYDSDGMRKVDSNGNFIVKEAKYTSKRDENTGGLIVTKAEKVRDVNGDEREVKTVYREIGNGMVHSETRDENDVLIADGKDLTHWELADILDKDSKGTTSYYEYEKEKISADNVATRDENKAIDALLKQRDDKIAEELQSEKQRKREASKKYTAKRNSSK